MIDKIEESIMKNWAIGHDNSVVSICCITYNHKEYISEAIDSFLTQETNFPFEILIGEDCSTDNTMQILEEYAAKYPNIIKLITSENNVGMMKNFIRTMESCKGEYIAICEGDDVWTSSKKLQIQYEALNKNKNIDFCFTRAIDLDVSTGSSKEYFNFGTNQKLFNLTEVIRGGGGFAATCTFFIRKEVFDKLPEWFYSSAVVGDYYLQILSSLKGGALYLPEVTAMYRINVPVSWTKERKKLDISKIIDEAKMHEYCLDEFSKYRGVIIDDINFSKAVCYYNATLEAIDNGYKNEVANFIEKSWNFYPNLKTKQKKIYKFRKYVRIISLYYSIKRYYKNLFS